MKRICSVLLACLLIFAVTACGQKELTYQEQYDLGIKYLSDGNYQEAVVAFTAAIEIEDNHAEAYVGRGDAHTALAGVATDDETAQSDYEQAVADYEKAVELGDTQTAEQKLEEVRSALQQRTLDAQADVLLQQLYGCFAAGDLNGAKELMRGEAYRSLSAQIQEGNFSCLVEGTTAVAVYPEQYYYYGDWKNGQRSGQGLWIRAAYDADDDSESYTYRGAWVNDLPNGSGTIENFRDVSKIQLEPGYSTGVHTVIEGNFTDGLYDGQIYETWYMNTGDTHVWTPITAIGGVYQPMQNISAEITSREYYQEEIANGEYIVALDQNENSTELWNSGSTQGVSGLSAEG